MRGDPANILYSNIVEKKTYYQELLLHKLKAVIYLNVIILAAVSGLTITKAPKVTNSLILNVTWYYIEHTQI